MSLYTSSQQITSFTTQYLTVVRSILVHMHIVHTLYYFLICVPRDKWQRNVTILIDRSYLFIGYLRGFKANLDLTGGMSFVLFVVGPPPTRPRAGCPKIKGHGAKARAYSSFEEYRQTTARDFQNTFKIDVFVPNLVKNMSSKKNKKDHVLCLF